MWNPVKELKVQQQVKLNDSSGVSWNPVKELKVSPAEQEQNRDRACEDEVESGEGIERIKAYPPCPRGSICRGIR